MIATIFDPKRAAELVSCLKEGKAILAPDGGWSQFEMLQTAGACLFGATTHKPPLFGNRAIEDLHPERRELLWQRFRGDLHGAIEFIALCTEEVCDGRYDGSAPATVLVELLGDVELKVVPVKPSDA
jgi:hypothetical protein